MTPRLALLGCIALLVAACDRPPIETEQRNYRGLGLEQIVNPRTQAEKLAQNQVPEPLPPAVPGTPPTSSATRNVQVLGHLPFGEFTRLMGAMGTWVAPDRGCTFCHGGDLAEDAPYQKVVARHMIQMVLDINTNWTDHVGQTGVTCYTCHRGQNVPAKTWTIDPGPVHAALAGNKAGQNTPAVSAGLTSLPYDPFKDFLLGGDNIRVQSTTALPVADHATIKQTEKTYGLMMHISEALGVNCGYCHNTRSFMPWEASSPARVKAWYAIRMVRHINQDYITPLADILPASRKGPEGDPLKVNCETCHRNLPKPLNGVSMLKDYPELATPAPAAPAAAEAAPPEPAAASAP